MILGIDAGNYQVKVCGNEGITNFISAIGESRVLNLQQTHGQDDMYFEYKDITGFAGSLALYESEFGGSIMGNTKAHSDTKIRVLIGIHRYIETYQITDIDFSIVVGQPIAMHNHDEKEKIKHMIKGRHIIKVNGIERDFNITHAEIGAEGASAYWSNPQEGEVRILDVGSATINYATILNGRYIDKDSDTLTFGVNTNKSNDLSSLARGISTQTLKKWNQNDRVFIVGGISEELLPYLKEYFPEVKVLQPIFNNQYVSPMFANAVAFRNVAVSIYG